MTRFQQRQLDLMRQMESSLASDPGASTIVPMQQEYETDQQIALTCVAYLPKRLALTIQDRLIRPLRAIEPEFYYYSTDALHITIQNIRVIHDPPNFSASDIAKVQDVLQTVVPSSGPFPFTLQGLLAMPTSASIIALVNPQYDRFVRHLRTALAQAGIADDKRYFTDEVVFANSTMCRYTHRPSAQFLETLDIFRTMDMGVTTPETVSLVTMNAGAHPSKTQVCGTYRFAQK